MHHCANWWVDNLCQELRCVAGAFGTIVWYSDGYISWSINPTAILCSVLRYPAQVEKGDRSAQPCSHAGVKGERFGRSAKRNHLHAAGDLNEMRCDFSRVSVCIGMVLAWSTPCSRRSEWDEMRFQQGISVYWYGASMANSMQPEIVIRLDFKHFY